MTRNAAGKLICGIGVVTAPRRYYDVSENDTYTAWLRTQGRSTPVVRGISKIHDDPTAPLAGSPASKRGMVW